MTSIIPPQLSATTMSRNSGKAWADGRLGAIEDELVGLGVERAHRLERRGLIQCPAPRHPPFLDPAPADPEPQFLPMQPRCRQIFAKQPKIVGDEVDRAHPEGRHGIAAVHPLAKPEQAARRRDFRAARDGLGAHHRGQHFELRQFDAEIAAEQPRPGAAGEHDRSAGDPPLFGDHGRDPAARGFDAAHRALGHDCRTASPRRLGDGRRPALRLGLAVAGGVERAGPVAGQARHQLPSFGAGQKAGVELVLPGVIEPTFELSRARPGSRRDT